MGLRFSLTRRIHPKEGKSMTDSQRRYKGIRKALDKPYPCAPKGALARHLNVLGAMIAGIIGSRSTNLPDIAGKSSFRAQPESVIKRLSRWIKDDAVELETYFMPFALALINALAPNGLVLVIDGSVVGRGCVALVIGLVYKQRALPIAWMVVKGKKGHFPETAHIGLIEQVKSLIPEGCQVTLLGDGEFDGIDLQALVSKWQWSYVLRTAKNITLTWQEEEFHFKDLLDVIEEGDMENIPGVYFTEKRYGPLNAICWWGMGHKEPIFLISNIESAMDACCMYRKRFVIETFFSDEKSRGFFLDKSHLSDPKRLTRLMIAACLAYHWVIFMGITAIKTGCLRIIHRTTRCDLSLFQIGLRFLDYIIEHALRLPANIGWKEAVKNVR